MRACKHVVFVRLEVADKLTNCSADLLQLQRGLHLILSVSNQTSMPLFLSTSSQSSQAWGLPRLVSIAILPGCRKTLTGDDALNDAHAPG